MSRVLPDVFRDCNVARLATFFRTCASRWRRWRPPDTTTRASCCSAPGPYNATYFEQAYLAQYLGYMLVDGADLTVRDSRVFLKTLGGLQPVDVILRRVDDDFCDPLELRDDSTLGVPGLLQAVRAGNVAVANAAGQRRAADGGDRAVPAAHLSRAARRGSEAALGRDLVVRRAGRRASTCWVT